MATMLLNAYARYEGLSYLSKCLTEPMQSVLANIESCELDPQKLPEENRDAIRLANENNLKQAAVKFLESILRSKAMMPPGLKNMCYFLNNTLETIISGGGGSSSPVTSRYPPSKLQSPIEQNENNNNLKTTTISLMLDSIEGSPSSSAGGVVEGEMLNSPETIQPATGVSQSEQGDISPSANPHSNSLGRLFGKKRTKGQSVDEQVKHLDINSSPPNPPSAGQKDRVTSPVSTVVVRSRSDSAPRAKFGMRDSPKLSRPQSLCASEAVAAANNYAPLQSLSSLNSSTSSSIKKANLKATPVDSPHASLEDIRGGRSRSEPPLLRSLIANTSNSRRSRSNSDMGEHIDINTLLAVKEATSYVIPVNTNSLGVLSVPEKIVGSFLFLRFFVPGKS